MSEKTLAAFARHVGISPATARQWKRRGKIVERDGGFELREGTIEQMYAASRVTSPRKRDIVERDNSVTSEIVTSHNPDIRESVTGSERDDSVTTDTESVTERDIGVTTRSRYVTVERDTIDALLSRIENCERGNATLQCQFDALRDGAAELEQEFEATVKTLRTERAENEARIAALEAAQPERIAGDGLEPLLGKSSYTGSRAKGPIDPPGPQWGA